ncbi:MAG: helix-hairpin-helix domain-containing protein [Chloroflexota bacterium]
MNARWALVIGLIGGLLGAGVLLLVTSPPRGVPITLQPPPSPQPVTIHIEGAVLQPGVYTLPHGSRVQEAINAAGGLTSEAQEGALNLAAPLEDGERIWVPVAGKNPAPTSSANQPPNPQTTDSVININTATQEELESLPGIGPVTAEKIIVYRQEHGLFTSIEEIQNVSGIGPVMFEKIKNYITVGDTP